MNQNRAGKSDQRETGLLQRMRFSVRALPISRPHVLLACSGGTDSVALAWILSELQRLDLITFSIAHVHHGQHHLADAAADAVQRIASELNVEFDVIRLQQADIDTHHGVGLEEALRRERYRALVRVATRQHADCIALAHHQTDQAETVLLHLIRGAGVDGLAGMRVWEQRAVPWWTDSPTTKEIALWRPLLREALRDIEQVAAESALPIVEDPTNTDTSYRRNAIRHRVLPMLEEIANGSTASIARSAGVIAEDAFLLNQLTDECLAECQEGDALNRKSLIELPIQMQRRVVRLWVLHRYPNLELSRERVESVLEMIERNRGGSEIQVGSGHRITIREGQLIFD